MRELIRVSSDDPRAFRAALEAALRGTGPAVLPLPGAVGEHEGEVNDEVSLVIETSGSRGAPKRVGISTEALLASTRATHGRLGGPGQWLLALPVNYVAGAQVLVRAIDSGIEPAYLPSGPFTPEAFVRAVSTMNDGRTYASIVPAQLRRLVEFAVSSESARSIMATLDAILVGGQHCPEPLLRQAQNLGLAVVTTYGATETSGGCVYDGIPLEGVHLEVDGAGQVLISGDILATEYISGDVENERFTRVAGRRWYATGDLGHLEAGRLTVHGRLDRVLISGGVKVSLDAIEMALEGTDYPVAVAVATDDAIWGQRPALVVEGAGSAAAEDHVRAVILEHLGKIAVPDRIVWVTSLPRLVSGKPDLVAIAALATS
jgi:O-succinylbenzoic acid--CoA ligase